MFKPVLYLIRIYLTYTLCFVISKPLFMLYNKATETLTLTDICQVILHGLPLDLSTAGYLTAFPLLLILLNELFTIPFLKHILQFYYTITALLLAVILCVDCALYPFWQFKLDATVFTYLDNPQNVTANVSVMFLVLGIGSILLTAFLFFLLLNLTKPVSQKGKIWYMLPIAILGGLFFILIRGGFGKSTMNIGNVYYSSHQFLNHSAVNPAFSLIASSLKSEDFSKLYRFFTKEECKEQFLTTSYVKNEAPSDTLLSTNRPDIVLVLLEGFSASFIQPLGGLPDVTPQFNNIAATDGLLFTHMHANSYRTDRGTLSILSGYPAFPQLSVMKMPEKSRNLPSIAATLQKVGYQTNFLYGGDINFTNMKSYLLSTGFQNVMGDTYFPVNTRTTHGWGVTDHIAFDTLQNQVLRHHEKPAFHVFLTLSSHEPWIVPYNRFADNAQCNAMAYVDDALGRFVNHLKASPLWGNLLVIFITDHGISYPFHLTEGDIKRSHIPMLWTGGALKKRGYYDKLCQQSDLATTLLHQLGCQTSDFTFSRDLFSSTYNNPSILHTFDNGYTYADTTGYTITDLTSKRIIKAEPKADTSRTKIAQTLLQTFITDLANK